MGTGELHGREPEEDAIAALLAKARAGTSSSLVLLGAPGIGKTALLDHTAATAHTMRLVRATGIQSEAELPFSGLHLLLRPALGSLTALPTPQRRALEAAFGLAPATNPEPMLVGLAVLTLLAEHADQAGLLCLVDDAQWLDRASRDALLFAARRLHAEGVVMIFAARDDEGAFPAPGLTRRHLSGLAPQAAAALLDRHPLTPAARHRLLTEADGNPLALLELPLALATQDPSAPVPGPLPLTNRLLLTFHGQASQTPATCQNLLLVAAADETGELTVILRAAATLGSTIEDLTPAEQAGLILRGDPDNTTLRFRHPLIRAALYQRAPLGQRLAAHRALAHALDAPEHTDRRAWHLAAAATGTDEDAAAALERTAAHARERSGHEAAAAAYARAAHLSADPAAKAHRQALAAEAALEAGDLERARALADRAAQRPDHPPTVTTTITRVRALTNFWQGAHTSAHQLLLDGAHPLRHTHPDQAAMLLIQALHTSWYLGEHQLTTTLDQLAALPLDERAPLAPVIAHLLHLDQNRPQPPPPLNQTLTAVRQRGQAPDQALTILCGAALALGQDTHAHDLATTLAAHHRARGGAGRLPTVLFFMAEGEVFTGRHLDALATATEALGLARDTGQQQWVSQFHSVLAYLDATRGEEAACQRNAEKGLTGATTGTMPPGAPWAHWSLGLLDLGLGRAEAALARFEHLTREPMRHHICATRCVPDLVESAVRVGTPERAAPPLARFERWAASVDHPWADALVLRCRGLLAPHDRAEAFYTAALELHDRDSRPLEYARTALLHGEWLRRARRRTQARGSLNAALEIFDRLGMHPWAERTRAELTATGTPDQNTRPAQGAATRLTPQELQIARLTARGLSNRDIAAQLFLSHRTVGYHLYKTYPKLGVTSRGELRDLADHLGL